jgi:hypothetical protein
MYLSCCDPGRSITSPAMQIDGAHCLSRPCTRCQCSLWQHPDKGVWIDDLFEEPDSLLSNASNETCAVMVMNSLYARLIYGDPQGESSYWVISISEKTKLMLLLRVDAWESV